jgi:GT2 family glycosyltransferase
MTEAVSTPRRVTVSAIVPAREAGQALALTLQSLRTQTLPQEVELSVLVVASDDDAAAFVAGQQNDWPQLRSIPGPKDTRSNGAASRNLGLAEVDANLVLWLEAGVCLPADWLVGALTLLEDDRSVVLAEIMGLGRDAVAPDLAPPKTPSEVEDWAESVRALGSWQDPRAAEFALATPTLPAELLPWTLGSTSAMLVRASLCREVLGFDEGVVGWAGADTDFSFKLSRAGATFRVQRDRLAVRLAISADHRADELEAVNASAGRLFAKYPCLETEAFLAVGQLAGTTLGRLERLPMEYAVPRYRKEVLDALRESLAVSRNAVLWGATVHLGQELATVTHLLAPSLQHHERLKAAFPERVVLPALGVRLPYEASALDLAIVSDFFGGLCNALKLSIVRELRRVAKRIVFICSPDIMTHARASFGWAKTDPQMLRFVISAIEAKAAVRARQVGPHLLVEVSS